MNNIQIQIDQILQAEDIEGLLDQGAPSDEYSSEAVSISDALLSLTLEARTVPNIENIVSTVWASSFNLSDSDLKNRIASFRNVAENIGKLF